jgi:hypothetical protein
MRVSDALAHQPLATLALSAYGAACAPAWIAVADRTHTWTLPWMDPLVLIALPLLCPVVARAFVHFLLQRVAPDGPQVGHDRAVLRAGLSSLAWFVPAIALRVRFALEALPPWAMKGGSGRGDFAVFVEYAPLLMIAACLCSWFTWWAASAIPETVDESREPIP